MEMLQKSLLLLPEPEPPELLPEPPVPPEPVPVLRPELVLPEPLELLQSLRQLLLLQLHMLHHLR